MQIIGLVSAVVGTIALLALAVHTHRGERNRPQRTLIVLGNVFALVAIWIQFGQHHIEEKAADQKHSELVEKSNRLLEQNAQLSEKQSELVAQNKRLEEQLKPVLEAAQAKHPGSSESEAIAKLLAELEKLNPRLEWLPSKTVREENVENGPFRTTFFFQSRYPVAIRDARLKLTFDNPVSRVDVKAPNTLPFQDNLKVEFLPSRSILVRANWLGEAGRLEVAVLSKEPVRLLKADIYP